MQIMQKTTFLIIAVQILLIQTKCGIGQERSFRVDYVNNQFLKDGEPFRFIAGSFHYFRALPETWQQKLRTLRASGLDTVTTYVEWSLHNPKDGVYNWEGIADVERFIRLATAEDLYVILRPGPYICAERDNGGFPYWLYTKYPDIQIRTIDPKYLREVRIWYDVLMARLGKYFYGRGGPIIMVQIENEYGSYGCDVNYRNWIRNETERHVANNAVLFTNDGPYQIRCGKIENVLATLDFGSGTKEQTAQFWQILRMYQPDGPLVNIEYYPGWLSHWNEPLARVPAAPVIDTFIDMLNVGASVNFYMFYGGSNFGFTAGANNEGPGRYQPDLTSYDYDAPMSESGDPTPKYMLIRDTIRNYSTLPNISVPARAPKLNLGTICLAPKCLLLSQMARQHLGRLPIKSQYPLTFEAIDQYSGFVLYETNLPRLRQGILSIPKLGDRAIVLVDNEFVGVLSRADLSNSIRLADNVSHGKVLQILVENQGRINYAVASDFKGIIGNATLNNTEMNITLVDWTITGFTFEDTNVLNNLLTEHADNNINGLSHKKYSTLTSNGPALFQANFDIDVDELYDTYIDPRGWGKGVIFINGFNLGRYWPVVGPQITLYIPKEVLRKTGNSLVVLELEKVPDDGSMSFTDQAIFN